MFSTSLDIVYVHIKRELYYDLENIFFAKSFDFIDIVELVLTL